MSLSMTKFGWLGSQHGLAAHQSDQTFATCAKYEKPLVIF